MAPLLLPSGMDKARSRAASAGASPWFFEHAVVVGEADIDDLGHVNNAVYLQYAEAVARAHSAQRGLLLADYQRLGGLPVVRQHLIRYRRPAGPNDRLLVSTRITRLGGLRAERHTEVRRADDQTLLVEIVTEWVWIDPQRSCPIVVPKEVLEAFGWPPAS